MKIIKIHVQYNEYFMGDIQCEHCGHIEEKIEGNDKLMYHINTLLYMKCKKCTQSSIESKQKLIPHLCPICKGNGVVIGSFYNSINGGDGVSTNISQPCKTCKGEGVLWV